VKTYKTVVKLLKKECPPKLPVRVRRVKTPKEEDGSCRKKEDHFLIKIDNTLSEHEAVETLIHEWAHALVWDITQEHTNEWGKAYSRVYRVVLKNVLTQNDHSV
jgi:hypothetical protein